MNLERAMRACRDINQDLRETVINEKRLYAEAISKWGIEVQRDMLLAELGEFAIAILKIYDATGGSLVDTQ